MIEKERMYYTIQNGNRVIGLVKSHPYVVGFRSISYARKVMYEVAEKPVVKLIRNENTFLQIDGKAKLTLDMNATIFISKELDKVYDPNNAVGYHIDQYQDDAFLSLPIDKKIGVILPFRLVEENDSEFVFRAHVFDPYDRSS